MSKIVYEGKGLQFSTYKNVTPYINDEGYWVVNGQPTSTQAQGADGVSFSEVREYYYAALAGTTDQGYPGDEPFEDYEPSDSSTFPEGWYTNIQSSPFGKPDAVSGVLYKYLWNVEAIVTTYKNETSIKYTIPNLLQVYEGGRIPEEYISYYAGNTTNIAPDNQPYLDEDRNEIIINDSSWETNGASADANNYLFEITFVRYKEKDENGKNLYAKIQGPTLIGRNGEDALNLTLNNDSDVIAIKANGEVISQTTSYITTVTAQLSQNGIKRSGKIRITSTPDGWILGQNFTVTSDENNGNCIVQIKNLPENFVDGIFTFTYNNLSKRFHLSTRQSDADFNLSFDNTLINSSEQGGNIQVKVKKTDASGAVTYLSKAEDGAENNIYLYYRDNTDDYIKIEPPVEGEATNLQNWQFPYTKGRSMPIYFKIEEKITKGEGESQTISWFSWDSQAIEFIKNGEVIGKYTLSLDNDYDTIVRDTNGVWISTAQIEVHASGYEGQTLNNDGHITVSAQGLSEDCYSWDLSNQLLTIKPQDLPSDFNEATFTFTWREDSTGVGYGIIRDTTTFKIRTITSIADYDLLIPQTVYNTSSNNSIINVQVQKKSNGGTEILDSPSDDTSIAVYLKNITTTDNDGDPTTIITYTKQDIWNVEIGERAKHIVLGSADGDVIEEGKTIGNGNEPSIIWDEEVIEFVRDGESGQNLYILYHDPIISGTLVTPEIDYDLYGSENDPEDGWYKTETTNSRYRVSKFATKAQQKYIEWGVPVINIAENGSSLNVQYTWAEKDSVPNDSSIWEDTEPNAPTGDDKIYFLWMRQKISTASTWGAPIRISAMDGEVGKDGSDIKYIYYRSSTEIDDWTGKGPNSEEGKEPFDYTTNLTNDWKDSPQGINKDDKYEYVSIATKQAGETVWSDFSHPPVIWSKWGEKGQDGDGIEYRYYRLSKNDSGEYEAPIYTDDTKSSWEDNPQGVDEDYPYEYVVQVKITKDENGNWVEGEIPSDGITGSLWAKWSEDGVDGCTLSLSSDSDTIVKTNSGRWVSTQTIVVSAQAYIGTTLDGGTCTCSYDQGSFPSGCSLSNNDKTLTIIPANLPNTFAGGTFTFTWTLSGTSETLTKKFSLKVATGLVDYDLIIPQTVYNKSLLASGTSGTIPITVQAKTEQGVSVFAAPDLSNDTIKDIAVYTKTGSTYTQVTDWSSGITYTNSSTAITIVLGSTLASGQTAPSVVWDEEVIEFVSNGERGERGYTGSPGSSACTISLEPDFLSISCDSQGEPTLTEYPTIVPTLYLGLNQRNFEAIKLSHNDESGIDNAKYYLVAISDGIDISVGNDGKSIELSNMKGQRVDEGGNAIYTDRATIVFTAKYKTASGTSVVAEKTFEATKRIGNLGAVYCYIESSLGTMFEESLTSSSSTTTTDLTARIFEGSTEIDSNGTKYNYIWHHSDDTNNSSKITGTSKTVNVAVKDLKNKEVWFTTSLKSNSQTT